MLLLIILFEAWTISRHLVICGTASEKSIWFTSFNVFSSSLNQIVFFWTISENTLGLVGEKVLEAHSEQNHRWWGCFIGWKVAGVSNQDANCSPKSILIFHNLAFLFIFVCLGCAFWHCNAMNRTCFHIKHRVLHHGISNVARICFGQVVITYCKFESCSCTILLNEWNFKENIW